MVIKTRNTIVVVVSNDHLGKGSFFYLLATNEKEDFGLIGKESVEHSALK